MDLGRRGDFWRDRTGLVIVLTTLNVAVVSVVIVCLVWCGVVGVSCGRLVCGVTAGIHTLVKSVTKRKGPQ